MITDREVFEILRNHGYALADIKNWMNKKQQADLRDEFAGKVLSGIMATHQYERGLAYGSIEVNDLCIARHCYAIADAMVTVRSEDNGETL